MPEIKFERWLHLDDSELVGIPCKPFNFSKSSYFKSQREKWYGRFVCCCIFIKGLSILRTKKIFKMFGCHCCLGNHDTSHRHPLPILFAKLLPESLITEVFVSLLRQLVFLTMDLIHGRIDYWRNFLGPSNKHGWIHSSFYFHDCVPFRSTNLSVKHDATKQHLHASH